MTNLVIASTQIRQLDGLFNLNDLHKAAGGEDRHRPTRFMRLDQTKELILEINNCPDMDSLNNKSAKGTDLYLLEPVKTIKGRNGGTFACKELFIAYAMWMNAKIHLQAIRALDQLKSGQSTPQQTLPTVQPSKTEKPMQYFITRMKPGQNPEPLPLDSATLFELLATQDQFILTPRKNLEDLINALGKSAYESSLMIQFANNKGKRS